MHLTEGKYQVGLTTALLAADLLMPQLAAHQLASPSRPWMCGVSFYLDHAALFGLLSLSLIVSRLHHLVWGQDVQGRAPSTI